MSLSTDLFDELCKKYGSNPYQISKALNIDTRQLRRFRDNTAKPRLDTLEAYAKAAGLVITYSFKKRHA